MKDLDFSKMLVEVKENDLYYEPTVYFPNGVEFSIKIKKYEEPTDSALGAPLEGINHALDCLIERMTHGLRTIIMIELFKLNVKK